MQKLLEYFLGCEQRWDKVTVPDQLMITKLKSLSSSLYYDSLSIEKQRPYCKDLLEKYNERFLKFSRDVQNKLTMVIETQRQFDFLLFKQEKINNLNETIHRLKGHRNENLNAFTPSSLEFTKRVLFKLSDLQHSVEKANARLMLELERAKEELYHGGTILKELLEPTHEWLIISDENKKKCSNCQVEVQLEKKLQPTIYEQEPKEYPHYW